MYDNEEIILSRYEKDLDSFFTELFQLSEVQTLFKLWIILDKINESLA